VADLWYYHQHGEKLGPVTLPQLGTLLEAGQIDAATPVWQQGMPEWVEVSSLGLLRGNREALPPPIPPPLPTSVRKQPPARPAAARPPPLFMALAIVAVLFAAGLGYVARGIVDAPRSEATVAAKRFGDALPPRPTSHPEGVSSPGTGLAGTGPAATPARGPLSTVPVEPDPAAEPVVRPQEPSLGPGLSVPSETTNEAAQAARETPAAEPSTPAAPPGADSPSQIGDSNDPSILFQALDIHRMPKLGMLGTVTIQDLRYQILSEIKVRATNEEGALACEQTVLETRLVKSDELSRALFEESLAALKGWQFSYQLNSRRVITEWKSGPPDGRKVAAFAPEGAQGLLATSVMDEDGWKELTQLTFFVPPTTIGSQGWRRPMMHNFGPLGSWYGETTFTPGTQRDGVQQYEFVHHMEYRPPETDSGELPFKIEKALLKAERAGGTIEYDVQARQVRSAQEAFVVRGALAVSLLGQAAEVNVEEQQVIGLRLHEQNPLSK
jgi:hypothetical protein